MARNILSLPTNKPAPKMGDHSLTELLCLIEGKKLSPPKEPLYSNLTFGPPKLRKEFPELKATLGIPNILSSSSA
jgi:hypothetical protein